MLAYHLKVIILESFTDFEVSEEALLSDFLI